MRIFLITLTLILTIPLVGYGQGNNDIGFSIGASSFLGEFGGGEGNGRGFISDMEFSSTRANFNAFYRKKISPSFALKGTLSSISLSGDDAKSKNPKRKARNLNFKNNLIELLTTVEWYIYTGNDVGRGSGRFGIDFSMYLFGGVGAFYSNPKGEDAAGNWVSLRELKSETETYGPIGIAIPFGIGFYYTFIQKYRLGMEAGWRTTFSDHIDDISGFYANDYDGITNKTSQELLDEINAEYYPEELGLLTTNFDAGSRRGNPKSNDSYLIITASFSITIAGKDNYRRPRGGNSRRFRRAKF